MTDISIPEPDACPVAAIPTPGLIFHRMSIPVLLFCAVFATALGVSQIVILPALTEVEVGGAVRDAAGLKAHAVDLQAKIAGFQEDRDAELMPLHGTPYRTLADMKLTRTPPIDVLDAFRELARAIVPGNPGAVFIRSAASDSAENTFTLTGDVSGVGPRSMTVLAQFTEMLRDHPCVAALTAPSFARLEDPMIGPHSPFTIVLILR